MKNAVFLLAVIAAASAFAQSKEPWALTLEERIALRTDPVLARERVEGARRAQPKSVSTNADVRSADDFNGQTHPELFLPGEVFRSLINMSVLSPPRSSQLVRKGLMREVKKHGLPPDFWERLQNVSAIYVADSWAERDLGESLHETTGAARAQVQTKLALKQTDVCRSRADALAAARKEFGRERFDRFLYGAIAINKFRSETELPTAEILRWSEGGCR